MQGSADRSCKGRGRQHFGPGGHVGYTAAPLFGPRGRRGHASQTRGELGASRAELRKHHAHGGRWVRALFFPHRCPRYFVNCRAVYKFWVLLPGCHCYQPVFTEIGTGVSELK